MLLVDPPGIDDQYLECLNTCYHPWGDQRQYHWYFQRETYAPQTQKLVLKISGQMAAGSAITYRRIALPNDVEQMIGIMTASWTLPEYRGCGCFNQLLQESLKVAANNEAAFLIAFVRQENASARVLERAGAQMFPSYYVSTTSPVNTPPSNGKLLELSQSSSAVSRLIKSFNLAGCGNSRFIYPSADDFIAQHLNRLHDTQILESADGGFAVIEKGEDTDIVQVFLPSSNDEVKLSHLLGVLLKRAEENNRKLFLFTTRQEIAIIGSTHGMTVKPGFISVFSTGIAQLKTKNFPTFDGIQANSIKPYLAEVLGNWQVHGGDRA